MATPRKPAKRRRKNVLSPASLTPADVHAEPPAEVRRLSELVAEDGGATLGAYREPYGGRWVLLVALPLSRVERTPYQRDVSDTHVRRLGAVISKVGRFLDPLIVTRNDDGTYWTPNGGHRLQAMGELHAKSITALLVPEAEVSTKILALNTEKAHNLREKALEVVRMARALSAGHPPRESDLALELEEGALVTLGLCYERNGRFSGGAYHAILKRTDELLDLPLPKALQVRNERAELVMKVDARVAEVVKELKERGLTSPYLRPFVVARCNPLRFSRREKASFDATWRRVLELAERFDPARIRPQDVAATGGPPPAED